MRTAFEEGVEILTPEHVPIRLRPAGLAARFYAVLVDWAAGIAILGVIHVLLGWALERGVGAAVMTVLGFLVQWGYHVWFETRGQGRTPGKRLCGLRVVDRRGLPVTFQQSFVRNILRALDFAPVFYGVGGLACFLDRDRRRLGDLVAGTMVIREGPSEDVAKRLSEDRRFNSVKTPRVVRRARHLVSLEEREFLLALCLRAEALDPKARFDLMEEVGGGYRALLEIDDPHLTGENIVRGLLSVLYAPRA